MRDIQVTMTHHQAHLIGKHLSQITVWELEDPDTATAIHQLFLTLRDAINANIQEDCDHSWEEFNGREICSYCNKWRNDNG